MAKGIGRKINDAIIKVLMTIIIASFVVWGIGDIFLQRGANVVASVGDTNISKRDVNLALGEALVKLYQIFGNRAYDPSVQNAILPEIINNLIKEALLSNEASRLDIFLGNKYIVKKIAENTMFKGSDGNFSKNGLASYLRKHNLSEKTFTKKIHQQETGNAILSIISNASPTPTIITNAIYNYQNEERKIEIIKLTHDVIAEPETPLEVDLIQYYQDNRDKYSTNEYRKITAISWDPQTFAKNVDIPQQQVNEEYKLRLAALKENEQRKILNITFGFDKEDDAKKAYDEIKNGADFAKTAKKYTGLSERDIDVGYIYKKELHESTLEDTVFSLKKGDFTEPMDSSFGIHIFKVLDIKSPDIDPVKIKQEIADEIALSKAEDDAYQLSVDLDDLLAAEIPLEEAASQLGLPITKTGMFDRNGMDENGKSLSVSDFIATAFELQESEISAVTATKKGKYFVLRVDGIKDPRVKALDEIKGVVLDDWRKDEVEKQLISQAERAAKSIAAGKNIYEIARTLKAKKPITKTITRNYNPQSKGALPLTFVNEVFELEKGEVTKQIAVKDGYIIARLLNISRVQNANDDKKKTIAISIQNTRNMELQHQYQAYLQTRYPVKQLYAIE